MSEWQPIETAPRDGTPVDLWVVRANGEARRVMDAWWVCDEPVSQMDLNGSGPRASGWWAPNQWHDGEDGWLWHEGYTYETPTHWRPRPAPPEATP